MVDSRVEKYKQYRDEIQNSFSEVDETKAKKSSDYVSRLFGEQEQLNKNTSSISFNELMNAFDIYDNGEEKYVSPLANHAKKKKRYIIFAISVCLLLLIMTIILGIFTFVGGYK